MGHWKCSKYTYFLSSVFRNMVCLIDKMAQTRQQQHAPRFKMTINDVRTSCGALQSSSMSICWHKDLLKRYWNVKCFINIGYFATNNYLSCINVKVSLVKCKRQSDRNLMEKMLVDIIHKINVTIWQCRLFRALLNGRKICDGKGVSWEPSDADALVKCFISVTSLATDHD